MLFLVAALVFRFRFGDIHNGSLITIRGREFWSLLLGRFGRQIHLRHTAV